MSRYEEVKFLWYENDEATPRSFAILHEICGVIPRGGETVLFTLADEAIEFKVETVIHLVQENRIEIWGKKW